jgi:hypothetical protein
MEYRDPIYPARTLFSDVRVHADNWRRFHKAARTWPIISITTYFARFFLMIGGIILSIWYEVHHDLSKGQGFLILAAVLVPAIFIWFTVEQFAWNYDLRQKGISSSRDTWKVSQFPQD